MRRILGMNISENIQEIISRKARRVSCILLYLQFDRKRSPSALISARISLRSILHTIDLGLMSRRQEWHVASQCSFLAPRLALECRNEGNSIGTQAENFYK